MTRSYPALVLALLATFSARPARGDGLGSPHAEALAAHRDEPRPARRFPVQPRRERSLAAIVYGYLPYWISDTENLRFADLTHLADFAIEMSSDGSVGDHHGWPDSDLVAAVHAAGARVEVTFTLFSSSGLSTLLGSASNRERAITNMIDELEAGGADGISVDFEGVPASAREDLVTFFTELRAALDARGHAGAGISAAGPAVDWGDAWDLAAIIDVIDVYFIMCYGYFWSGSSRAGPPGLFRTSAAWSAASSNSILRTVAEATREAGEEQRGKIVCGVPYYGREFTTSDASYPTATVSHIGAVTYSAARARLAAGSSRSWDDGIRHPAIIEEEGGSWHQTWYDDEASLAYKYELFREQEIGGTGMWALGFDGDHGELWDLLEEHYSAITPLGRGSRDQPIVIDALPFVDTADTNSEGYRYFNYYSCSPDLAEYGRELVYRFDVCQEGTVTAAISDGDGIDIDVHLLAGLRESTCLARDNSEVVHAIGPGRYYLVFDTFVNSSGVEQSGLFDLSVDFAAAPDSAGCPAAMHCEGGDCVCADGLAACADDCVDLTSSAGNCGKCGMACGEEQACQQSACVDREGEGGGCGCRSSGSGGPTLGLLLLLALLGRRRTC